MRFKIYSFFGKNPKEMKPEEWRRLFGTQLEAADAADPEHVHSMVLVNGRWEMKKIPRKEVRSKHPDA